MLRNLVSNELHYYFTIRVIKYCIAPIKTPNTAPITSICFNSFLAKRVIISSNLSKEKFEILSDIITSKSIFYSA